MNATVPTEILVSARDNTTQRPTGALTGTGTLIWFILRRERIKLSAWILGITLFLNFALSAVAEITKTEEQRQDLRRFLGGTVGAVMGPGYGRDDVTAERYVVGVYGLFFFILVALMSMLLVVRHTRVEEQNGRAELIRSSVVGRYAQLTAVLSVAVGANVLLALLLGGTAVAHDLDGGDGLLFGASVGAVGLVFAGLSALAVQITVYSGTATGSVGATLGAFWAIRAAGDMISDYGSPLSWLSPLAWSNQTRPFVDGRWWPLLLSVGFAAIAAAGGYLLSTRRDVGAGLIAARHGNPRAAAWLSSPLALAFRLRRSNLIGWTLALALFGFMFGALGDQIADPEQMSESRIEMFGGSVDTLVDGYLGMMALFFAVFGGIMAVLGVQAMRSEETKGRLEPVLATATSRWTWFGSYLAVISVGLIGLLLAVGLATGTGAALALGDSSYIWDMTVALLAHAPGVLIMLGVAALLFGSFPRMIGLTWVVIGFSLFVGLFGTVMDLPRWAQNMSPMEHVGRPPLDSFSWPAELVLLVIAAGLMAAGLAGFRRRDLESN